MRGPLILSPTPTELLGNKRIKEVEEVVSGSEEESHSVSSPPRI
jgi:hypothetical protein